MISFLLCSAIFSQSIIPQNIFLDRYVVIPSLGYVKSITCSPLYVFAISDNYLLVLDKQDLNIERTFLFKATIDLIGYDQQYDELWISGPGILYRLSVASYNKREYQVPSNISRFGINSDHIYLDAGQKFVLNKISGEITQTSSFPGNLKWYEKTTQAAIKNHPFLTPYYYTDLVEESQSPFDRYSITSLYDDGKELYVGTDRYGILKYSTVSWQKKRIIYGPLDANIKKVKIFNEQLCLISNAGISYYPSERVGWKYIRFNQSVIDFAWVDNNFILGFDNRLVQAKNALTLTISNFKNGIISVNSDATNIYVGTNVGLFKIIKNTEEPLQFGPEKFRVNVVYPTEGNIYVGGEIGFYGYDRETDKWSKLLNQGIKDIVDFNDEFYLLSVENQLIKYQKTLKDSLASDTTWSLLPYFNIYDIDTDSQVIYCASHSGIHYYEPETGFYKKIFNLPSIKYDYVFIDRDNILAIAKGSIYRLAIKDRD